MARAMIIVLDSVGCGAAPDAAAYGDEGSDTLGHIARACAAGRGGRGGLRAGPLHLPNLAALGLSHACRASTGQWLVRMPRPVKPSGLYGCAIERSQGKDTPSGHWEIAGCPVPFQWGYFTKQQGSFPPDLLAAIIREGELPGILGDCHASGTLIIDELGAESVRTGKPICYTSVDSVFQIAAHEEAFGLQRLYDLCRIVRRHVDPLNIGRVIARPFIGTAEAGFTRTANRKDFAVLPPNPTLLDHAVEAGRQVVSIGKIGDIFAHRATGTERKGKSNDDHVTWRSRRWRRWPMGASPSSTSSTSIPITAIAATRPAMPRARGLRPPPARDQGRAARGRPGRHHRRPRQRPDLARHRPHPRERARARLRPRHRRPRHRPPRELRRHRPERRRASGPEAASCRRKLVVKPVDLRPPLVYAAGVRAGLGRAAPVRCCSSVVEHSLGKGEVESSILSNSTSLSLPAPFQTVRLLRNCARFGA